MPTTGNGVEATVMSNYAAVLRFHNLSNEQKDIFRRDFLRILRSSGAWGLKIMFVNRHVVAVESE